MQTMSMTVPEPVRNYLREIGSRGGARSRRTITPEQQRRMQEAKKAKRTQKTK